MALRRRPTEDPSTALDAAEPPDPLLSSIQRPRLIYGQQFFDDLTRELIAISGDEFVKRYDAGRYDDILDDPWYSDLMYLALLGGLGRQAASGKKGTPLALRRTKTDEPSAAPDADDARDPYLPPMRLLTITESQAFFDDKARQLLGISGDEFIRRYHSGRYDDILDDPWYSDLMYLAMLGGLGR